jgi:hypothetical protein
MCVVGSWEGAVSAVDAGACALIVPRGIEARI